MNHGTGKTQKKSVAYQYQDINMKHSVNALKNHTAKVLMTI